ncbi:MAG: ABC transporter ATP-binding protein [Pseudomonadota bacterium]
MTALSLKNLTVRLGAKDVLTNVTLEITTGECVGLIGPNGAGKSTLMRAALGLIPAKGRSSLAELPRAERARRAAWLPQAREIAWGMTTSEVISLGRTPHRRPGAPFSQKDKRAVADAMRLADVEAFADRPATDLSGGEQARVLLARALAQEAPIILADEPIAGLDPAHQLAALEVFAAHARDGGTTIVSLHDLSLAARWCTRLVLLDHGRLVADGAPEEILTAERLAEVYGIEAHLAHIAGGLSIQPIARVSP